MRRRLINVILSYRFIIALLTMLATMLSYSMNVDLSVNIVCMVNRSMNMNTSTGNCPQDNNTSSANGDLLYTPAVQGLLQSAFYWGYALAQIPSGVLSARLGSRLTMSVATFVNAILIFCYEVAARKHWGIFLFLRIVVGIGAGMLFPGVSNLWSQWAPIQDRTTLIGFAVSGSHLGNVVMLPLGGYLCVDSFKGGWPSLFYVLGVMLVIWSVTWFIAFRNKPRDVYCMSEKEKKFISENAIPRRKWKLTEIPWLKILTNKAFLVHSLNHACVNWGFFTLLTNTPSFMSQVMCFNIKSYGGFSSIPYAVVWATTIISAIISDIVIDREYMTRTATRKMMNTFGTFGPGAFLLGLGFVKAHNVELSVILLILALGCFGFTFGGGFMNVPNDIGGSISGVVFSIANTIGAIPGLITPYITKVITANQTLDEWHIVFYISSALYFLGGTVFLLFGSAENQHFASAIEKSDKMKMDGFASKMEMGEMNHVNTGTVSSTDEDESEGSTDSEEKSDSDDNSDTEENSTENETSIITERNESARK